MISVDEALQLVLQHAAPLEPVEVPSAAALGFVLAEQVISDIDSPPHDKSMVDGYAIVAADLASGSAELEVVEEVVAGGVPQKRLRSGEATRIMTGAPIPQGADAVVMVEHTRMVAAGEASRVQINDAPAKVGQNILPQASSLRRGDVVLEPGASLRPIELGLLAEVGRSRVRVFPQPQVAVLSTGNELVPAEQVPAAGQIRNSNGPMLAACVQRVGATAVGLGIARDDRRELVQLVRQGLHAQVLVLSGGVSAGILDLVPGVLAELGVREVFHKVRLKPGKPLWFGVRANDEKGQTLVFGLPGNPVSSLVCFELFVRPALEQLAGHRVKRPMLLAKLASEFTHRGDRPTCHPAHLEQVADGWTARPLRWRGSADLRALAGANALICFPAGERSYAAGESVEVRPL